MLESQNLFKKDSIKETLNTEKQREPESFSVLGSLGLHVGKKVHLVKHSIGEGKISDVNVGQELKGVLKYPVNIGQGIYFEGGGNTSSIRSAEQKDGKIFLKTTTSVYELIKNDFEGLTLKDKFGDIELPSDAKDANLDDEVIEKAFRDQNDNIIRFYINKPELKNYLLEVNGGNIFRSAEMQGRIFVLAKVKNIHLPFYISSSGTSGKNKGQWYPFFGYASTGRGWLVKGSVNKESGEMDYHPEITRVQNILNENLVLPDTGKFLSQKGTLEGADGKILFDINEHLKYQNSFLIPEYRDGFGYEKRITGYSPGKVCNDGKGSAVKWINDIISSIK